MKTFIVKMILGILAVAAAYGQVTVSGSVRDDSGAVPSGVTVQIQQIIPLKSRAVFQTAGTGAPSSSPAFSATASVDETGSFSFSNVPAGTHIVCAYGGGRGLLSNCQWASLYTSIAVQAADTVIPTLVMTNGTVVTLNVQDPAGALEGLAPQTAGVPPRGAPPSGHYFYPGLIADNGYYSSAQLISHDGSSLVYMTTIPKTVSVHVFIDSDLTVTDSSSNVLATRKPSNLIVQGGADTAVNLSVQ